MRAYIATGAIGTFAFDGTGRLIDSIPFGKDPGTAAEKMNAVREGKTLPEEEQLAGRLKKRGFTEISWNRPGPLAGLKCFAGQDNIAEQQFRADFRKLAKEAGWNENPELNRFISTVGMLLSRGQMKNSRKDLIIVRAIGVHDELEKALNTLSEHLREWYGLYFPEASRLVQSHEKFAVMISKAPKREEIEDDSLRPAASATSGMEFSERDLSSVSSYSAKIAELYSEKKRISEYIKIVSEDTMPNMSAVAGHLLAARLLARAGGLDKISRMPSSTIQLLGAEKALFRHLKDQGKSPKYGLIYQHPLIQCAPMPARGKVARMIASKLTLAARMDQYSDKRVGEEMRKDLETQVRKLLESGTN
jgi:nucleolar protein 56